MSSENLMGMKKFKTVTDLLLSGGDNPFNGEKLDIETLFAMFEAVKDVTNEKSDDKAVVDYLIFFPFLLSFYFQFTLKEIN